MNKTEFVDLIVTIARKIGCRVEINRNGITQIDFGNKKLHAQHLEAMFPEILYDRVFIAAIIDKVAPGSPCTYRLMRAIIAEIKNQEHAACDQ